MVLTFITDGDDNESLPYTWRGISGMDPMIKHLNEFATSLDLHDDCLPEVNVITFDFGAEDVKKFGALCTSTGGLFVTQIFYNVKFFLKIVSFSKTFE